MAKVSNGRCPVEEYTNWQKDTGLIALWLFSWQGVYTVFNNLLRFMSYNYHKLMQLGWLWLTNFIVHFPITTISTSIWLLSKKILTIFNVRAVQWKLKNEKLVQINFRWHNTQPDNTAKRFEEKCTTLARAKRKHFKIIWIKLRIGKSRTYVF